MFDYVLTGPISGVSAGLYLAGLINETAEYLHLANVNVNPPHFAAGFAIVVTVYFWRKNIIGIHESSEKALRIMQITTVMVVILVIWCLITIFRMPQGPYPIPFPSRDTIKFGEEALGWIPAHIARTFTFVAIMIGLGHSLLAMSGEESLAQVNREIASPKLKNLERAGFVIFVYSMVFTSLVSFFAVWIMPDAERAKYLNNLIGGLSMFLVGPVSLRLLFHAFVVLVGTLILAGAVNTAIIGSNGVLNRVAEDGVMPDWFRHPHSKFGTTSRLINLIVILQIVTIVISRGDVIMLGEAYAFGVVWSFAMKALAVLVLRFKMPGAREWKVPLNFHIGETEIPVGLGLIALALLSLATINVLTKKVATISGLSFTIAFFVTFELSEKYNKRRASAKQDELEKFRLDVADDLSAETVRIRPGNVLVAVRNPNSLDHLKKTLEKTDTRRIDIAVLAVRNVTQAGSGEHPLDASQLFTSSETELFSKVVYLAEKAGKHVELIVVPGVDPNLVGVQTAQQLQSSRIVAGVSTKMTPAEQGRRVGEAWEKLPQPRPTLSLEIIDPATGQSTYFNLGPHPPQLWPEDIELVHNLWLEMDEATKGAKLRHRDVIGVALRLLENKLHSEDREEVIQAARQEADGMHGESKPGLTVP
jgi:amino acid transporter